MSSNIHAIQIIVVMAAVTFLLRVVPFLFFGTGSEPPEFVKTLGRLLPPALMSVLVVYCIRNVDFPGSVSHGIPEIVCILTAMGLHAWKRNVLLSIVTSTALYMFFVQVIF